MGGAQSAWLDDEDELAGCTFGDVRLTKRLRILLSRMEGAVGAGIPLACQDSANTKAAYRFFSNDRTEEAAIPAGHFAATRNRFQGSEGRVLILKETTDSSPISGTSPNRLAHDGHQERQGSDQPTADS